MLSLNWLNELVDEWQQRFRGSGSMESEVFEFLFLELCHYAQLVPWPNQLCGS